MEFCKETEKYAEKGDTDSPPAKSEDKENKLGMMQTDTRIATIHTYSQLCPVMHLLLHESSCFCVDAAAADDVKMEDALEGRLNGDRDTLDEMDESRREDKNGFKAKFMFNIADGGFTGKTTALKPNIMAQSRSPYCKTNFSIIVYQVLTQQK